MSSDLVRNSLGMPVGNCCDGVIFYAHGQQIIICLVEMKSDNLSNAEKQVKDTYGYLYKMLIDECKFCKDRLRQVIWRAYIYRSGGGPKKDVDDCVKKLEKLGFESGNVMVLGNPDITDFLRNGIRTFRHKHRSRQR